jgi:hypothetical protein
MGQNLHIKILNFTQFSFCRLLCKIIINYLSISIYLSKNGAGPPYQEWGRPSISRMGQALHIKNGADPPYQEWGRPSISRMGQALHIKSGADPPYQEWGRPSILRMGQTLHIKNGAGPPY